MSSACSVEFVPISVGTSFSVKVTGYKGAIKGLLLTLGDYPNQDRSAVTDNGGVARFRDIPPGTWYIGADRYASSTAQLKVSANSPKDVVVKMPWPSIQPIRVRSIAGTIEGFSAGPGRDQPVLSLELLEGASGRVLSSVDTSKGGEFDFGHWEPGVYFINLKPHPVGFENAEGPISIALDPAGRATASKLDLHLVWTSCGLMYVDQSQCKHPDLRVNKAAGRVTDEMGRAMSGGIEILLLDESQTRVATALTDSSGNFSFPDPLSGTFQLRVDFGGFAPIHTPIRVDPAAGRSSLQIQASLLSCSTIRAK